MVQMSGSKGDQPSPRPARASRRTAPKQAAPFTTPAQQAPSPTEISWPERIDNKIARLLLDMQWLAYFEREPLQASAFMQQRLKALLTFAMENSAWWRE